MPPRESFQAIWEALPEGAPPADAPLRERLLLDRLATVHGPPEPAPPESAPPEPAPPEPAPPATAADGPPLAGPPRVLDLGCGEGRFAAAMRRAGASVTAADVAPEALRRASAAHPLLEVRLLAGEAELPFEDCAFDAVWAGEVIAHVSDTAAWLSEVRRVLRSGGMLLLSTPNHPPLELLAMAVWRGRFEERFDPRSSTVRFYTRRTLAGLLAGFGFERVDVRTAGGLPGARRVLFASAVRARF